MHGFVVLTHDHPFPHWDLMLQVGDALRTWRLLRAPDSEGSIDAEPLPDHRLQYLDYEGPVSGGRGEVRRWDHGQFVSLSETPSRIEIQLRGEVLSGRFVLQADDQRWSFRRSAD